ncbi:MAG: hypothetical protein HY881_00160 [Deltaproteobacteria bacterium]|nr:hypothetical protein [Deltaproteobacteria bacterium]
MLIPLDRSKIFVFIILQISILLSSGCFKNAWSADGGAGQSNTNTQTFVTYKYIDPMTRMEVFRMLIPKSWKAEGEVKWSADPALPVQSRFRFFNPSGSEELNFFPAHAFFWTSNTLFLTTNPPGSLRFGTRVAKPVALHEAFTRTILPDARRSMGKMVIIRENPVSELAGLARGLPVQGVHALAEAGKMRIGYDEGGKQMEEEFYAAVSQFVTQMPGSGAGGGYFINYWYIDYVFSFRDEKGKLDSRSKIFQTMVYSLKFNQQWIAKVVNVKEMITQSYIKGIKAIGQMGQMIAQAGSQMREDQQRAWEQRQQVNDRIVQNFSDHIRGVERYNDSRAGKEVELPAGYGNAWANDLGEYIVSESPSFNPNIHSNQHWEPLTPAR